MLALKGTDGSTTHINHGTNAVFDAAQGTIIAWVKLASVTNTDFRHFCKYAQTDGSSVIAFFVTSNNIRMQIQRATTNQFVDIPAASLTTAWAYWAFTWDITNGGPKSYVGSLTSLAADVTTSASDGTGAKSSVATPVMRVGANHVPGNSLAFNIANFFFYTRDLSLAEIQDQQFDTFPTAPGCALAAQYGADGTRYQIDKSGRGNHGLNSGMTLIYDPVLELEDEDSPVILRDYWFNSAAAGRTTKNTRGFPLGVNVGMGWRMGV